MRASGLADGAGTGNIGGMDPTADSSTLRWQLLRFAALTRDDLYEMLQLRSEVFVLEQRCPYLDADGKDRHPEAHHLLGRTSRGELAAYLRLLPPGLSFTAASFGRVVTSPRHRGRGHGDALVARALRHAHSLWPQSGLMIGAQAHLARYYGKHGFVVCSDEYLEDGIPHLHMQRPPQAGALAP
jgi:ElaA protein